MKLFIWGLAIALFGVGISNAQQKELVIGMEMSFPPFEMLDTSGQPAGVSVEMAKAMGKYLQRPIRFENIPFDGLIPSLKTGKVDLVISSMTVTQERSKSIDFSDPYLEMGLSILANKNSSIQSIADVDKPNITVAVKKATTGHIYAIQHFHNAKILIFSDSPTCATEVAQGKADCMIYDQISIFANWRKYQDSTRAILQPFQTEEWAMGIRKGNDELRTQVNAFLKQFKESGGFNDLGNKYFGENKKIFQQMGIPFYF
ncbi:MAG TPA: transporter substrate-binding domain-containing protein [Chthoniobacterales bacterium]